MSDVVDSSAWLEYFGDGPNADFFAQAIETPADLVVPSLVLTEVVRRMDVLGRSSVIAEVLAHMRQGRIIPPLSCGGLEGKPTVLQRIAL